MDRSDIDMGDQMTNQLISRMAGKDRQWPAAGRPLIPTVLHSLLVGLLALTGGVVGGLAAQGIRARSSGWHAAHPLVPRVGTARAGTAQGVWKNHGPDGSVWVDTTLVDTTVLFGRQDLTGYTTPILCLAAMRAAETVAHRSATDSASYFYRPEDTLSSVTVAVARRCGRRFTVEGVPPAELLDLAQLALAVKDDAKARAAAERYAAMTTEPEAHRWALYAADTLFFHAKPRRWALADAMTARLDSLGPPAVLQRKLAHDELYLDAHERYDVARLRREALALFAICAQLSAAEQEAHSCTLGQLALNLFEVELYQSPGDVPGALDRTGRLVTAAGFTDWARFRQVLLQAKGTREETLYGRALAQIGTQAPPLVAQHWVGAKGRAPGWPVKGKVSIFLRGRREEDQPERFAVWRRLGTKYKEQLDITILVATQGYFRREPPLAPATEAERLGKYYREQLGVPATVAVVETPTQQLPPPDGRFILGEPPLVNDPYYGQGAFLLTDRTGKVLLARLMGSGGGEAMLDAWIARALGR